MRVWAVVSKLVTDCFTERDGVSWCYVRIAAAGTMTWMTYKFVVYGGVADIPAYGATITGILGVIGFKNYTERD